MRPLRLICVLALAGCNATDPYVRAGEWRPIGANTANLRAMVANPADLYLGRAPAAAPGDLAADAVGRLRTGQAYRLPASNVTDIKVTDPSAGASGAQAAPAAAASP